MMKKAAFGAGCFWHIQNEFDGLNGVVKTFVGYAGGSLDDPSYEQVSTGKTGYVETVEIGYDDKKVSYEQLLDLFWKIHDPTSMNSQGADYGSQYKSVIFYYDEEERKKAEKSKIEEEKKGKKIVTEIWKMKKFWPAESYHQHYFKNKTCSI